MMDIKNINQGSLPSITTMVGRAAIAKNQEQKMLMEQPIREEIREKEPTNVGNINELSKKSNSALIEGTNSHSASNTGKLVDLKV